MSEEPYRIVHKGSNDIHVYWVDDCFTVASTHFPGGVTPHSRLGYWDERANKFVPGLLDAALERDTSVAGENGAVYLHLRNLAVAKDVCLYTCSFEYAEANWMSLNRHNCLLLLDIGYFGKPGAMDYGIDLWIRLTTANPQQAKVRFLTAEITRVGDYCGRHGVEPDMPMALSKSDAVAKLTEAGGRRERTRLAVLVDTLIAEQPTELGNLGPSSWNVLRSRAWEAGTRCDSANEWGYHDGSWVHHLPGGGKEPSGPNRFTPRGTNSLQTDCQNPLTGLPLRIPPHFWELEPRWKSPPVRAIVQRDAWGRDLSRFFYHVRWFVYQRISDRLVFEASYPVGAFKHDYLWFNVVALGEAMVRMAEGFEHEMAKAAAKGHLMWTVREVLPGPTKGLDGDRPGLEMIVRQIVNLDFPETVEAKAGIAERGKADGSPCGAFIPKSDAKKALREAHEFFERAGATVCGIGPDAASADWRIFIEAKEDENGVWSVCEGDIRLV